MLGTRVTKKKDPKDAPKPVFTPRARRLVVWCVLGTVALTAVDLWSKAWALDALSAERVGETPAVCQPDERGYVRPQRAATTPISLVDDHLELHYAENCGAAFGMLRSAPALVRHGIFGTAAVLASIALFWMFATGRGGAAFAWAVPFIVSGALGNLVDRVRLGYVVDFIRLYWSEPIRFLGTQWPTFNIADATITVGVVLLLIDGWREGKAEKEAAKAPQPEPAAL